MVDEEWYKVTKDVVQSLAWIGTIVGALVASFKVITEVKQSREQRLQELRWKQANLGRELVDEVFESPALLACLMLDYAKVGRVFPNLPSDDKKVAEKDILKALDVETEDHSDRAIYIRECFEELLYYVDRLDYFVESNLVTFEDVKVPLEYYHYLIREHWGIFVAFAERSRYIRFKRFFGRFENGQA